jgi:two-component system chemotaxis sensor kinase CheA
MMADADNDGLFALFASECGAHLDAIRTAAGVWSAASDAGQRAAAAAAIRASLHTLAGAARAVDLLDLEYLCRAVETLAAAGGWNSARLPLLDEALSLAPKLSAPTGRLRNQVLALAARCQAAVANACGAPA